MKYLREKIIALVLSVVNFFHSFNKGRTSVVAGLFSKKLSFFNGDKDKKELLVKKTFSLIFGFLVGIFLSFLLFLCSHKMLISNNSVINKNNKDIEYFLYDFDNFFLKDDDFLMNGKGNIEITIKYNDNLSNALINSNFNYNDVVNVIDVLKNNVNLREIPENQEIFVDYSFVLDFVEDKNYLLKEKYKNLYPKICILDEKRIIDKVYFKMRNGRQYFVNREKNNFAVNKIDPKITEKIEIISGTINEGLFVDASKYDVKANTLFNMLNEYAFLIDFQRDIHKYDKFIFILKKEVDEDNDIISEKVLYSNLILLGKKYEIFYFNNRYYNREGGTIKRALLKTPVDGARVSSSFNPRRKHPILGYTKAHTGIDLAVPMGTPIYASGNGVISEIQLNHRGYGKFITIRHNKEYSTRYAHMSRIANLKVGQRVVQKQVIGYVGMTGMATGPHLHYEVIRNGIFVDPRTIRVVSDKKIDARDMIKFAKQVEYIDGLLQK